MQVCVLFILVLCKVLNFSLTVLKRACKRRNWYIGFVMFVPE